MRGEGHAFLPDLAQSRKRKNLKASAVGQDGSVPAHEPVQTAHRTHHLIARTQVQVIRVGKLDLAADVLEVKRAQAAFDRRLRADIHKYRRLHFAAVGAAEFAAPGFAFIFDYLKHKVSPNV